MTGIMRERGINMNDETRLSNLKWAYQFPKVKSWLNRRKASINPLSSIFRRWYMWMMENCERVRGLSPDELLEFQREARKKGEAYEYLILDRTTDWIKENEHHWRRKYQIRVLAAVRSFFAVNRAELPRDSEIYRNLRSDVAPVKKELTLDDFKRIVEASNIMHQAVLLSMLSAGVGPDEVVEWSDQGIRKLEEALDSDLHRKWKMVRIDLRPRKTNPDPYFTFIGGDALKAVKDWLDVRTLKKAAFEENTGENFPDSVFVNQTNTPLTVTGLETYWRRKMHRLRIVRRDPEPKPGTRYGRNLHQIRSLFRTQCWRARMDEDAAEFMIGHRIDRLNYNKFFRDERAVLDEHLKLHVEVNIISSAKPFGKVDEDEVETLRQKVKELERRDKERDARHEQLMERVDNLYGNLIRDVRIHPEIQKQLHEGIRVRVQYIDGLGEGVLHIEPIETGVVIEPIEKEEESVKRSE